MTRIELMHFLRVFTCNYNAIAQVAKEIKPAIDWRGKVLSAILPVFLTRKP